MRWYKAAVDCRVMKTGDPHLIALYHWLLAQAKATQAPGGLAHAVRIRNRPLVLEPGQVVINTTKPPLGLTRRQLRTLLSRLHDLDRCIRVANPAATILQVVNPVDVQEVKARNGGDHRNDHNINHRNDQTKLVPENGLSPPGDHRIDHRIDHNIDQAVAPRAHSLVRSQYPEESGENLLSGSGGSGELVEKRLAAILEAGHPLSRAVLKQKLESVAVRILGRLWFATEVETLGEAVQVARQAGLEEFLAGWGTYCGDRRLKGKDVRLRWFMEELDRWMPRHQVTGHSVLRPHLGAYVADGTITEEEAWEIQNGAPWVDRNDILAHIPGRRAEKAGAK